MTEHMDELFMNIEEGFTPQQIEPLESFEITNNTKDFSLLNSQHSLYPTQLLEQLRGQYMLEMKEDKSGKVTESIVDTNLVAKWIADQGLLLSNNHIPMAIYEPKHDIWKLDQNAVSKLVRKAIVSPLIGKVTVTNTSEKELASQLEREVISLSPEENPFEDNQKYLIPFTKTYNIKTNAFQENNEGEFFTGRLKHLPIPYDTSEKQDFEKWLEFLLGDSKRTFLEFLGLSFINNASLSQSSLVSVGNTLEGVSDHGNGKSELQLVVKRCFESVGKELSSEVPLSDMTGREAEKHLKPLIGALVNFDDDADTSFIMKSEGLKKLITGQAKVTGRTLYEAPISFQNKANFWLNTNKLPKLSSSDGATERRIDLLVFQKNMRLKENQQKAFEIYDYETNLLGEDDTDLRKLIYLAIQTARSKWYDEKTKRYNKEPLYQSDYAKKLKGEWKSSNNPVLQFIDDTNYTITNDENDHIDRKEFYEDFKEWVQENGNKTMSNKTFRELVFKELELQKVGKNLNNGDIRLMVNGERTRVFYGIKLVTDEVKELTVDDMEEIF